MNEKIRIEKVMKSESMTSGQFAQEIGIQNSTLSHILNNRNNPSLDVMKKILNRFPNINSEWLILGQGPMSRQETHSQMPTLFGFDEEKNSISDTYVEKNIDNINSDFSSVEKNEEKLVTKISYVQGSQKNVAIKSSERFPVESDEINKAISGQLINKQEDKVAISDNTSRIVDKKVTKIILYYSDNTFQEFDSK
jgi:transcriptional regulator with XRE-family HTH domain